MTERKTRVDAIPLGVPDVLPVALPEPEPPIPVRLTVEQTDAIRAAAIQEYAEEGVLEIDETAIVSYDDETGEPIRGAYVAAWVWVEFLICQRCGGGSDPNDWEDTHQCFTCNAAVEAAASVPPVETALVTIVSPEDEG